MIVKDKTLESSITIHLDDVVIQYLELGWELYGPQYYNGFRYVQVMTLRDQDNNEDRK
jgi:hypothetical protein